MKLYGGTNYICQTLIPLGKDKDNAHVEENGNLISLSLFVKKKEWNQIFDEKQQIVILTASVIKISNSSKVSGALWSENE